MSLFIILIVLIIFICVLKACGNLNKSNHTTLNSNTIPEKYSAFPVYSGTMSKRPVETVTEKYDRLTLFYKGEPDMNYLSTLYMHGFQKASDVRHEKDNTYVIFEKLNKQTKIAYHIKKI